MKLLSVLVLSFLAAILHAQNIQYVSGNIVQDTRWSGQIYIDGDVVVQKGVTLSIDSGSRIVFKARQDKLQSGSSTDRIEFVVLGKLLARGKPRNARIIFTSDATEPLMNDWHGIVLKNPNEPSLLQHCVIEYAYKGVTCYGSSPVIEESEIRFNYIAGVSCEVRANPIIRNCRIFGNDFAGINCELASSPVIENSWIIQNTNGVIVFDRSQPDLGRNPGVEGGSIGQNHIQNNFDYNIYNHSSMDIYAQNNSWNTTDEQLIRQSIYDRDKNPAYGRVLVSPIFRERQAIASSGFQQPQQQRSSFSPDPESQQIPLAQTPAGTDASPEPPPETTTPLESESVDTSGAGEESSAGIAETPLQTAAPETVFLIREVPATEVPQAEAEPEFQLEEPVIEGLLDAGKRQYIRKVAPEYPRIYQMTGYEGVVLMEVVVGRDGIVQSYRILRSDGEHFTRAAEEAIVKYRYKPGTFKNKPVSYVIVERFQFQLSK